MLGTRRLLCLVALSLAATLLLFVRLPSAPGGPAAASAGHGRVAVKFKPGAAARRAQAAYGALAVEEQPRLGAQVWHVPAGAEAALARELAARPDVLFAEPELPRYALATPNDRFYAAWQWNLVRIGAPDAWDLTRGSAAVRVAVIDSGFDVTHPDRPANLELGCDFVAWTTSATGARVGACPPVSRDDHGHGTSVSSIIAARWNNGIDIAGVAPNTRLLAIRGLDAAGRGNSIDTADAIVLAADAGARVINVSLGSTVMSAYERSAIEYAIGRGALLVAAAGNCGVVSPACPSANPTIYPAAHALEYSDAMLAVAAATYEDTRATYSNRGRYVSIAAPGGAGASDAATPTPRQVILTLYPLALGRTAAVIGTSSAAPHVAAVAGLMLSLRPDLTAAEVVAILRSTARRAPSTLSFPNDELGDGHLDALAALRTAREFGLPTATATGTRTSTSTATSTATPTLTPTATATPDTTGTATPTPSATATATPTATVTPSATPSPSTTSTPRPGPSATSTATAGPSSLVVDEWGGILATDNGGLVVRVPSGVFAGPVTLSYRPEPAVRAPPPPATRRVLAFELTSSAALTGGQVLLDIKVGERDMVGVEPAALRLVRVLDESGRRVVLPAEWIAAAGHLRGYADHFSTFEVLVQHRRLLPLGWR